MKPLKLSGKMKEIDLKKGETIELTYASGIGKSLIIEREREENKMNDGINNNLNISTNHMGSNK